MGAMQRELTERIARLHAHAAADSFNIGHRGARAFAPENTLAAFAKAIHLGCHMVELDVHLTLDEVPVVHHDDDLLRCTDAATLYPGRASYYVSDFTAAQIASLDAGRWFSEQLALQPGQRQPFLRGLSAAEQRTHVSIDELREYASGAVRVPTLAQVCELVEPMTLLLNVEIKSLPRMYPTVTARAIECLRHYGMEQRTLLSSFDHEQLIAARSISPQLATAVLTSDRLAKPAGYLELLDADAYHPSCHGEQDSLGFNSVGGILQRQGISEVLESGKDVNTWTCNDASQMRALLGAGVTGVFTDYPNRLAEVLRDASAPAPGSKRR
jgi:glycerophosphoryl diester phosphodiesterase